MKNILVLRASLTGGGGKVKQKKEIKMGMLIVLFTIAACFVSSWLFIVWEDACARKKNIGNELNIG